MNEGKRLRKAPLYLEKGQVKDCLWKREVVLLEVVIKSSAGRSEVLDASSCRDSCSGHNNDSLGYMITTLEHAQFGWQKRRNKSPFLCSLHCRDVPCPLLIKAATASTVPSSRIFTRGSGSGCALGGLDLMGIRTVAADMMLVWGPGSKEDCPRRRNAQVCLVRKSDESNKCWEE